jgi:hypothetical protein
MGGECPIGNLYTDASRWQADADFAVMNSGGIRGPGWDKGPVRTSNLWEGLPYPNTLCTGVMSGLSVFRLMNFSTYMATYETAFTVFGDRLLQVSGMKYTYNTQLEGSRLISVEIYNRTTEEYEPLERLKLYKFASDSWMCSGFDPFPSLFGSELVMEGEIPGKIDPTLHYQAMVGYYLASLDEPYDTSIQGRLSNDTATKEYLDWIHTEENCKHGTYWIEKHLTCFPCPDTKNVVFTKERIEFDGDSGSTIVHSGRTEIINNEKFPIVIQRESSPSWIDFTSFSGTEKMTIGPGSSLPLEFTASAATLEAGTALGAISFAVLDGGNFPGCVGRDATFEVFIRISPQPELNKPESIRFVGLTLMSFALLTCLFCAFWVWRHREKRIVKAMQPQFLSMICAGNFIIALSIIPMSIEDEISSQDGRNMSCMATPWLLSTGFTLGILSLYAKLWRINQLFHGEQFRRVTITAKEVSAVCGVLFALDILLLLLWTLLDPLVWEIGHINDEPWNQYGACSSDTVGVILFALTAAFTVFILILACIQAYKARAISDEYSESRNLGIALFGWVEILLVGFPVLFLIEQDNTNAKYFLQVILVLCVSMSMQLIIFIPMMVHFWTHNKEAARRGPVARQDSRVRISGLAHSSTNFYSEVSIRSKAFEKEGSAESPSGDFSIPKQSRHSEFENKLGSVSEDSFVPSVAAGLATPEAAPEVGTQGADEEKKDLPESI